MRGKTCEVMQYVNVCPHLTKEFILEVIQARKCIKQYAFILHDKDQGKNPHWHIMLQFDEVQDYGCIAKWFNVEEQYVSKCKQFKNALLYLIHAHDPSKYQYDPNEVICNFDYVELVNIDKEKNEVFDFDLHNVIYYKRKYKDNARKLNEVKCIYNNYLELKSKQRMNRSMNVIYISGMTGCGKTTFAKCFAYQRYGSEEVYISSSSNDILDGYNGERCIILDDYRDSCMRYDDLLKFLDNNTTSSVKSRYNNKQMCRCEMIIITSTELLTNLYKGVNEDKQQLYRRVKEWCKVLNKGKDRILTSSCYDKYEDGYYKKLYEINITAMLDEFFKMYGDNNSSKSIFDDLINSGQVKVTKEYKDLTDDELPF